MFWCFFHLKGLTGWLCFIVYFAFMCIKHAMTWLQPKDLRWSSRCVSHLEKLSFYSSWIYLWHHLFISVVLWIFHFENCHFCNVRCLFALLILASLKFQTFKAGALVTLMLLWSDCQLFHCLVCLYVLGMAVQIIKIWKWKENVWRKTCCTWG